ncbi:Carboxyl-terminal protease [Verrucomicrobia bacterium]|nr:Carboxyl-terminal protease [Verrucomicrobiota bacterium]
MVQYSANSEQFLLHFVKAVLRLSQIKVMIERFVLRILLLTALAFRLAAPAWAETPTANLLADNPATPGSQEKGAVWHPISPGPVDGRITYVTVRMLESLQYLKHPFDETISSKLLDHYLEALDPQHVNFIQADLDEFAPYRTNIERMTLTHRGVADPTPAFQVFNRFIERLQAHVAYVDEVLKNEKFNFTTDERITVNRHEMPYPKDLTEAKKLWRERLEYEYLSEHLLKLEGRKKAEAAAKAETNSAPALGEKAEPAKTKSEDEEIVETLTNAYHYNLRNFTDWNNEDVLQAYLDTVSHLYDPHSDYMGPEHLDSFAISMNLSLSGIGAELFPDKGYCTIRRLLPGGPASKSKKVHEKDRILAVAQSNQPPVNIIGMSLTKAVQLIRGPKGTEVRLTLMAEDSSERRVLSLIRDQVKLDDQAAKAKIIEVPTTAGSEKLRLGVIDLPSFYAPFDPTNVRDKSDSKSATTADVSKLIEKLKEEKVAGVVLDLRHNGGGSLEEAVKLTGLFIKKGPVVQVRDSENSVQELDDTDPSVLWDGPLIVLTSRFSASASEIVAGALQDYGRALIVGESSTHGKGTVQAVNPLRPVMRLSESLAAIDPGALKVTIKKFYRPSGASTQKDGVVPDIILPSVFNESKEIGEAAMENALPWDTIQSAKYEYLNRVAPYLPELRQHSSQRIATDPEFAYVREDIEQFKKVQADKTVSLNEKERLKEKAEADARQKAREKERAARKDPPEIVYELTVKQAGEQGLPAPLQKTNSALAKVSAPIGAAAVATNSAAVATNDSAENADQDKPAPPDVELTEAEHILVDYLAVLGRDVALTKP